MAGKNQHYIPQAIMRPFKVDSDRYSQHVYVFRKGEAIPSNPKAICSTASSMYFYSDDKNTELDYKITCYENYLARMRDYFLSHNHGNIDQKIPAEYITHLTIRSAHLRDALNITYETLLTSMLSAANEDNFLERCLTENGIGSSKIARECIKRELQDPAIAQLALPEPLLEKIIFTLSKEQLPLRERMLTKAINSYFPKITEYSKTATAYIQRKWLLHELAPAARVSELEVFDWDIYNTQDSVFILPDCIAICFKGGSSEPSPLICEDIQDIATILIPISPFKLLVGTKECSGEQYIENFNHNAAKCCSNFFVSSYKDNNLCQLLNIISKNITGTLVQKINFSIEEIVNKYSPLQIEKCKTKRVHKTESFHKNFDIDILNSKILTKEHVENLTHILKQISSFFLEEYPITTLGKVFFTETPPSKLTNEVNSFSAFTNTRSEKKRIISDIYVHSKWALKILSDDSEIDKFVVMGIFITLLSRVYIREKLFLHKINFLKKLQNPTSLNDIFTKSFISACEEYFVTKNTALMAPKMKELSKSTVKRLDNSIQLFSEIKVSYCSHRSADQIIKEAYVIAHNILLQTAIIFGHNDGLLEQDPQEVDLVLDKLKSCGLDWWAICLWKDLVKLSTSNDDVPEEHILEQLSSHLNRIFWQFGIFVWEENTVRKVHVMHNNLQTNPIGL